MGEEATPLRSPPKVIWALAYLLSPALPFVCLRYARAIGTAECLLGMVVALATQVGLISVLGETNGEELQLFLVLQLGLSLYVVVLWQFLAGKRVGLWSPSALRQWRTAGRFFGVLIFLAHMAAIASFHLQRRLDPNREGMPSPARQSSR